MALNDLTDRRFGKLVVIGAGEKRYANRSRPWVCQCDCGAITEKRSDALTSSSARLSCGCSQTEAVRGSRNTRWMGGVKNKGSVAWSRAKLRVAKNHARRRGYVAVRLDAEQLSKLVNSHDGECDICGRSVAENGKELSVDHCHETGEFRGFLCQLCNTAIGALGDCPSTLAKAVDYLRRTNSCPA